MLLRRLYLIFLRYAEHNLTLDRPGGDLCDATGRSFGRVTEIRLRGNRLIVEGWSQAARVGLILNRTRLWCVPELTQPGSDARGFALDIPFEVGDLVLQADEGGGAVTCTFDGFTVNDIRRARIRLVVPYIRTLIGLLPEIWRWKREGDLGAREVVKERLGLVPASTSAEMLGGALEPFTAALPRPHKTVTIVLPVYNAYDVLTECLARVAAHTDLDWHMIVVEDRSTDDRVWPMLQDWAGQQGSRVTLLRNDENLGFIGGVNRGLGEAAKRDAPVVLLNSDALVPAGWASRLLAPFAQGDVASVTPMSNDAEIFTVPVICQRHDLTGGMADVLDAAAQTLNLVEGLVDAPTGVGFCMALSPEYLRRLPRLDTIFGKGYGEETDWCQKARALGGRHVCTPHLFVEHRGGESFGSAAKQALLERNGAEISRRYPTYDAQVQEFIRTDPLNTARLALGLVWAATEAAAQSQGEVPVYVAHAMGGGAEKYLQDRIARDIGAVRGGVETGGSAVVLRVGQGHTWKLELHTRLGSAQGRTNDVTLIKRLLAYLPRMRLIYSCGVGARDAVALPQVLMEIAQGGNHEQGVAHPVEVLFHDFFPVSPSYTLLGRGGVYHGVPVAGGPLADDPAHTYVRPGLPDATLADWQGAWGPLVSAAERCVVFSDDSRRIVQEAYPQTATTLVTEPHPLLADVPRIEPVRDGTPVIGVLGNIGYQKGAAVLQKLSRDLARTGAARLVVIGHLDPAWPLAAPAQVHGSYELRDLAGLVARYRITGWLIPSIWPETFSFTTHEALATGMPVLSFDLGAQGDAVAAAVAGGAAGGVIALPPDGRDVDITALLAALQDHSTGPGK
ncbi:glycosyltransferase [uncultured Sulfitobacter sp.]|uniref:glycosyltransferase n=1 Tax=uncultured Sulfitobacter sp. TaxID=191468 RepID=UPI002630C914|nr:glycosyltransferase [uncultured Sulfitobacter sp.]